MSPAIITESRIISDIPCVKILYQYQPGVIQCHRWIECYMYIHSTPIFPVLHTKGKYSVCLRDNFMARTIWTFSLLCQQAWHKPLSRRSSQKKVILCRGVPRAGNARNDLTEAEQISQTNGSTLQLRMPWCLRHHGIRSYKVDLIIQRTASNTARFLSTISRVWLFSDVAYIRSSWKVEFLNWEWYEWCCHEHNAW